MKKQNWIISVGGGYGSFLFKGSEQEAEEMRSHKANWEQASCTKRLATEEEIKAEKTKKEDYKKYLERKNKYEQRLKKELEEL